MMEYLGEDIAQPICMLQKGDFINHKEPFQIGSAFDLAWLCGLYWLFVKSSGDEVLRTIAITLTQELIDQQQGDGSWAGSPSLRVTDPSTSSLNMGNHPKGNYFVDHNHSVTTASVLQVFDLAKAVLDP